MAFIGKVALVTGASSGIGAATARMLAKRGARVVLGGLSRSDVEGVAESIRASGGEAVAVGADISDEGAIVEMVAEARRTFGRLDILHANAALTDPAAMALDGEIAALDAKVWDRALGINLRGSMLCCKHVIPEMLKGGGGSIIMTGSGKGVQGDLDLPAYAVSKAGLICLAQYIATQYGKRGIRANVVLVGLVMTEALAANVPKALQNLFLEHHLTPFIGSPDHVASVVSFLASEDAAFVTGHVIPVDGGFTSHSPIYADMRRMQAKADQIA
jgi:NAD(P)-dependent dehydrogenase (short-subunit alcohol dehydrogenase family)